MGLRLFKQMPLLSIALLVFASSASAQLQQPAGVHVDAKGVLRMQRAADPSGQLMRQRVQQAKTSLAPELNRPSPMRAISLNRLEAAVDQAVEANAGLTPEMLNLAGLTEIRYVFFYPESGDIVLAGPAEGFVEDLTGRVVGTNTGRATLQLEDLVVALRAYAPNTKGVNFVGVSIDPTQEGLQRMQQFLSAAGTTATPDDTQRIVHGLQQALGLQTVTIAGISPQTHFAQVLVEADYRMKLIGIGLEQPPVKIPSYTENSRPGGSSRNALKRWFFTPNYETVKVTEDGLAMELVGQGVKLIGENEMVTADGGRQQANQTDRASFLFTSTFTKKYDELADRSPVYGQLRSLINLLIVSAYIHEQDYYSQADFDLGIFNDEQRYPVETYQAPETVETAVNAVWKGSRLLTPIGGGVSIKAKEALTPERIQRDEDGSLAKTQKEVTLEKLAPGQWWWD